MNTPYRVIYPESVRNGLRDLHEKAAEKGLEQSVLAAIRMIDSQLASDPQLYGEPKYHYRALNLQLRVALEPPLVVHYTVHDELPLVFVKAIRSLPAQGF